jgi:hypothetical protein
VLVVLTHSPTQPAVRLPGSLGQLTLWPTQLPVRRSEPSMSLLLVLAYVGRWHDMSYRVLKLKKKHLLNGVINISILSIFRL